MMTNLSNIDQCIADFEAIKIPVKRVFKLYYKRYPYRITLDHDTTRELKSNLITSYRTGSNYTSNYTILMLHMGECFGVNKSIQILDDEIVKIYNSLTLSIFFEDEDMFIKFANSMKLCINDLAIIAAEGIADILAQDDNIVIKKEYYFKKFPYRVQLARYKLDEFLRDLNIIEQDRYHYDPVLEKLNREAKQEYFLEWAKDNLKRPFHRCKVRIYQEVPTMFFLAYEDVVLFKMQFVEFVTKVDRIKLLKTV